MNKRFYALLISFALISVVSFGYVASGFSGSVSTVIENASIGVFNGAGSEEEELGAMSGPNVPYDMVFEGQVKQKEAVKAIALTSFATSTLLASDSGTTYYLSASGSDIILPSVAYAGANFRFVVGGALDTTNVQISSAERDNIDGTLIVAGAVVDCDGEDQVNIIVDGENVGDYVEFRSDGTKWYIGDSGALTSAKMTCTDPY